MCTPPNMNTVSLSHLYHYENTYEMWTPANVNTFALVWRFLGVLISKVSHVYHCEEYFPVPFVSLTIYENTFEIWKPHNLIAFPLFPRAFPSLLKVSLYLLFTISYSYSPLAGLTNSSCAGSRKRLLGVTAEPVLPYFLHQLKPAAYSIQQAAFRAFDQRNSHHLRTPRAAAAYLRCCWLYNRC